MKISGVDKRTGDNFETEIKELNIGFFKLMSDFEMSEAGINNLIDNLDISADAKSALHWISTTTIKAGKFIIQIGRKIIDFVCSVYKEFPSATFGMIFGGIVGCLISSIPVIGFILGPVVTPLFMAWGVVSGGKEDIADKRLARKIAEINAEFSPLNS